MLEVYNDSTTAKRPSKGSTSEIYTSSSVIMNYSVTSLTGEFGTTDFLHCLYYVDYY